jgi:hypothetical protein
MGKADDFLNSPEALELAQQVDVAGAGAALAEPAAPPPAEPAPLEPAYQPLGAETEHPAFAGLDAAAAAAGQQLPPAGAATPAGAPAAQAQAAQAAALRDRLVSELGLTALADAPDDWAAVQQIVQHAEQRDQYARELAAQMQQLQGQVSWLQQQQQFALQQQQAVPPSAQLPGQIPGQPAPAAAAQPASTWPKPPEWDPAWEAGLMRSPETGELVSKPGYDPSLPQKYSQRKAWEQNTIAQLLTDPTAFAEKSGIFAGYETRQQAALAKLRDDMRQEYQAQLRAVQEQQFGQQFAAQHAGWLFQQDLSGRPMIDPRTGQQMLSQEGQRVIQQAQLLVNNGLNNPQLAMQLAYNIVSGAGSVAEAAANELNAALAAYGQPPVAAGAGAGAPAGTVQPPPAMTPQQLQNQAFLQRTHAAQQATRQPSRAGAPATPQTMYAQFKGLDRDQTLDKLMDAVTANPEAWAAAVGN